jgi:hypothetical protein
VAVTVTRSGVAFILVQIGQIMTGRAPTPHIVVVVLVDAVTLIQAPPQLHPIADPQLVARVPLNNEQEVGGGDDVGCLLNFPCAVSPYSKIVPTAIDPLSLNPP